MHRPLIMNGRGFRELAGKARLTGGTFWLCPCPWLMGNEAILQGEMLRVSYSIGERYQAGEQHNDILDSLTVWVFNSLPESQFMNALHYDTQIGQC